MQPRSKSGKASQIETATASRQGIEKGGGRARTGCFGYTTPKSEKRKKGVQRSPGMYVGNGALKAIPCERRDCSLPTKHQGKGTIKKKRSRLNLLKSPRRAGSPEAVYFQGEKRRWSSKDLL